MTVTPRVQQGHRPRTRPQPDPAPRRPSREKFAGGIDELVIGKNLNDLDDIKKVSGSSFTSGGFKKAIAQIKEEAAE